MMFDKLIKKLIFCAIMVLVISSVVFAEELDPDDLESHPVTVSGTCFDVYPAVMYNHFAVTEYDAVKGEEKPNNFYGPLNDKATVKYGSYGLYNFNENTNLFAFIKYCNTKDQSMTNKACDFTYDLNGINTKMNYSDLLAMCRKSMTSVTYECVKKFFNNMKSDEFIELQDQFIFEKYAMPGIDVAGFDKNFVANSVELSTAFFSIMYNYYKEDCINPNSDGGKSKIEVKQGNVRMFLYKYSMKDGSFVDDKGKEVTNISSLAEKIAKFAYIGLIYGGEQKAPGTNYWENEYEQIFGDDMLDFVRTNDNLSEDMSDEDVVKYIKSLYSKAKTKYKEKGEKGNPLLGSDISRIIESQYSMENRLNATKDYLQRITGGKFNDNIAKNYLMARYMMENEEINNTIDDYCPGVVFDEEKFRRGSFDDDKTKVVITSDFQILTLKDLVSKRSSTDSDEDGLKDGQELTTSSMKDITNFLDLAYKDKGLSDTEIKNKKEKLVEFGPNGYIYDPVTGTVKVKVYDYISNPKLKDTDFDGIGDKEDNDKLDSNFKGTMKIEDNSSMNIDFNQDFRYFFIAPKSYNDELAVMSLIPANLASERTTTLTQIGVDVNIEVYMNMTGFKNVGHINMGQTNDLNGICFYGINEIDYYGAKKKVLGLFFGGFNNEESYKKLLCKGINEEDDESVSNLYSSILTECENQIENIVNDIDSSYCIWISGFGIAGTVASEVAKNLTASGEEVYAYIFAAPTSSYSVNEGEYENIKIIVNEDDLIQKIRPEKEGYTISGKIYNKSVGLELEDEYRKYVGNPASYSGNYMVTNTISNELIELNHNAKNGNEPAKDYKGELPILLSDLATFLYENYHSGILSLFTSMPNSIKKVTTAKTASDILSYKKAIKSSHSIKAYYTLAKSLDGYDDRAYYDLTEYSDVLKEPSSEKHESDDNEYPEDVLSGIETVANWYIKNVPTYKKETKENTTKEQQDNAVLLKKDWGDINLYKFTEMADKTNDYVEQYIDRLKRKFKDEYENKDIPNDNLTKYIEYGAGDDCARFAMTVYNYITGGELIKYHNLIVNGNRLNGIKKEDAYFNYGNTLLNRNTDRFVSDDYETADWFESMDYYRIDGEALEKMEVKDLKPGDILCSKKGGGEPRGHVEFYLGYNYNEDVIDLETKEKVYIRGIKIDIENNKNNYGGKAASTFGWGSVHNKMPVGRVEYEYNPDTKKYDLPKVIPHYFYKASDGMSFRICYNISGHNHLDTDCECDKREYNVIYRKKGY